MINGPPVVRRPGLTALRISVSAFEWNSGNVSAYDPIDKSWKKWKLPGQKPRAYAVWVDPNDKVWLSDWAANALIHSRPFESDHTRRAS
jgi:streptogramin lyase